MSKHTLQNPILESWSFGLRPKTSQRLSLLKRLVPVLLQLSPRHQLWIVEPDRIRYREE
jgi:hypothetical protein